MNPKENNYIKSDIKSDIKTDIKTDIKSDIKKSRGRPAKQKENLINNEIDKMLFENKPAIKKIKIVKENKPVVKNDMDKMKIIKIEKIPKLSAKNKDMEMEKLKYKAEMQLILKDKMKHSNEQAKLDIKAKKLEERLNAL